MTAADELERDAEALRARWFERCLDRTARLAARLRVLVELGPMHGAAAHELEDLRAEVEDLGWVLGRLGAALGADAMGPRHHPRGLALLVDLASQELAVVGDPPDLAPGGHELVLTEVVALLIGRGGDRVARWGTEPEVCRLVVEGSPPREAEDAWLAERGLGYEPGSREPDRCWTLVIPSGWVQDARS